MSKSYWSQEYSVALGPYCFPFFSFSCTGYVPLYIFLVQTTMLRHPRDSCWLPLMGDEMGGDRRGDLQWNVLDWFWLAGLRLRIMGHLVGVAVQYCGGCFVVLYDDMSCSGWWIESISEECPLVLCFMLAMCKRLMTSVANYKRLASHTRCRRSECQYLYTRYRQRWSHSVRLDLTPLQQNM